MKNWIRRKLINLLVGPLFNGVGESDFLHIKGRNIYIGGMQMNDTQTQELKNAAKVLKQMHLWTLLNTQVKLAANRRMFEKSTSYNDMYFGKAMLYNVDMVEQKVNKLSQM